MSAEVVAESANEWDTKLTLKVECRDCTTEWGWTKESSGALDRLQSMAAGHNERFHAAQPAPTHYVEYFGRLEVHQPIKPKPKPRKAP